MSDPDCVVCASTGAEHRPEHADLAAFAGDSAEVAARLIDRDGRILCLEGLDLVGEFMADLQRRLAENDALLDAAIERAKRRAETLAAPLKAELERRKGQVAAYLQQHRDDHEVTPKGKKTRELPSGLVVGFRKQPAGYRLDPMRPDARALLLAWAAQEATIAQRPDLVEYTPRPSLDAVKAYLAGLRENGDARCPPGLIYVSEGVEEMVINVKEKA